MTNAVGLTFRRHSRALLFLVCAVGIDIVCGAVAARSSSSDALEVAATLDLVFFVPVLCCLLLVRGRGWPVITLLPVHLLVALWSPTAAWVVTGLSAYAVLWIVGDYRAVCLRPVVVTDHELLARVGLRWTLWARLGAIASVESTAMTPEEGGAVGLKLALVGSPRVTVRFREPVPALGPYGARRRVSAIKIGVDEPERLMRALHERGVTKEG